MGQPVPKILAVVPSGFCFGLQNAELAFFAQASLKLQCHFLTTRWTDGEFVKQLGELKFPYSSTWLGMFSRRLDKANLKMTVECLLKLPIAWRDFIRLYRSYRPDIVYFANHHEIILLLPLLLWIRRKVVCRIHDPPPAIIFQKLSFRFWRCGVGRFLFISENARERLAQLGPLDDADIVVHNGGAISPLTMPRRRVDRFCKLFDWPDDSIIIGMSGQISLNKGQEDFVEAASIAHSQNRKMRFVIGGRGDDDFVSRLKKLVGARGLDGCIKFSGWLPNPREFYKAIDIFVLASRHEEGFGLVVAEAGERGLPIIATRSGGAIEVLVDGETGVLVEKEDAQALARSMTRFAADGQLRDQMGQRARERIVAKFNLAAQADRFSEFLTKAADEAGQQAT
jgi:glycosyltransferase involved in cell wall biosynthesis